MEALRQYLLSVTAAALLCSLAAALLGDKGTIGAAGKLISGLVMAFVVISPLTKLDLRSVEDYFADFSASAQEAVAAGEIIAAEEMASIIKERTEAYILDKAASLGVELQVRVDVAMNDPPAPEAVHLTGSISPYTRQLLQESIAQDLGIPKEKQVWTT